MNQTRQRKSARVSDRKIHARCQACGSQSSLRQKHCERETALAVEVPGFAARMKRQLVNASGIVDAAR